MEFSNKVVVITGGAGGIGIETAKIFAREGASIVLVDLYMGALKTAAEEIKADNIVVVPADVSQEAQVEHYVNKAIEEFGKIDVFINNAGIEGQFGFITDITGEQLDRVLNVNIKGVFYGLKHVVAAMKSQNKGSIINISSVAGLIGSVGLGPYVASKHAVLGLTKTAALEYAQWGIRVNAVCPGPINNRMMRSIEQGALPSDPASVKQGFEQQIALKRYGESEEVGELIVFLASDRSSYITGSYYTIDGGLTAG